jgi:hypothetical protein
MAVFPSLSSPIWFFSLLEDMPFPKSIDLMMMLLDKLIELSFTLRLNNPTGIINFRAISRLTYFLNLKCCLCDIEPTGLFSTGL